MSIAPDVKWNLIALAVLASAVLVALLRLQWIEDAEEKENSHLPDARIRRSIAQDAHRNIESSRREAARNRGAK